MNFKVVHVPTVDENGSGPVVVEFLDNAADVLARYVPERFFALEVNQKFATRDEAQAVLDAAGLPKMVKAYVRQVSTTTDIMGGRYFIITMSVARTVTKMHRTNETTGTVNETAIRRITRFCDGLAG